MEKDKKRGKISASVSPLNKVLIALIVLFVFVFLLNFRNDYGNEITGAGSIISDCDCDPSIGMLCSSDKICEISNPSYPCTPTSTSQGPKNGLCVSTNIPSNPLGGNQQNGCSDGTPVGRIQIGTGSARWLCANYQGQNQILDCYNTAIGPYDPNTYSNPNLDLTFNDWKCGRWGWTCGGPDKYANSGYCCNNANKQTACPTITSLNQTSGPAGSNIIILGNNFGINNIVNSVSFIKVGATTMTSVSIREWTNERIVTTVPGPEPGVYNIIIERSDFARATLNNAFTVTPTQNLVITQVLITTEANPAVKVFASGNLACQSVNKQCIGIKQSCHNIIGGSPTWQDSGATCSSTTYSSSCVYAAQCQGVENQLTITSLNQTSGPAGTRIKLTGTNLGPAGPSNNQVSVSFIKSGATTMTSVNIYIWDEINGIIEVPVAVPTLGVYSIKIQSTTGEVTKTNAFTVTPTQQPTITALIPQSGPAGTPILIKAADIGPLVQGKNAVSFIKSGETTMTSVTIKIWNEANREILVNAPLQPGDYSIIIERSDGIQATLNNAFTVVTTQTAITSINPNSDCTCAIYDFVKDGVIDIRDTSLVLRCKDNPNQAGCSIKRMDVNNDGVVNDADLQEISNPCYGNDALISKDCDYGTITCQGCILGSNCVKAGTRVTLKNTNKYCNINNHLLPQKQDNVACNNDYECQGNVCIGGKCTNLQQELAQSKSLLQQIMAFLQKVTGIFG